MGYYVFYELIKYGRKQREDTSNKAVVHLSLPTVSVQEFTTHSAQQEFWQASRCKEGKKFAVAYLKFAVAYLKYMNKYICITQLIIFS